MQRVAVVDYGMGNLRSVAKAIEHVARDRAEVLVTQDAAAILDADRVVFPGQGAIRDCMSELARHRLIEPVVEALRTRPFLGICLGLQALLDASEEHVDTRGLGVFRGTVRRFPVGAREPRSGDLLKVPHMGWNRVCRTRAHPLWEGIDDGAYFYFVHGYYVDPDDRALVVARTDYGFEFTSAIAHERLFAVQFHPEKSGRDGLRLLENFLAWDVEA